MKKESSGAGVSLMKSNSSGAGAGATFMNRRAPEPELCHFYQGASALSQNTVHAPPKNWAGYGTRLQ